MQRYLLIFNCKTWTGLTSWRLKYPASLSEIIARVCKKKKKNRSLVFWQLQKAPLFLKQILHDTVGKRRATPNSKPRPGKRVPNWRNSPESRCFPRYFDPRNTFGTYFDFQKKKKKEGEKEFSTFSSSRARVRQPIGRVDSVLFIELAWPSRRLTLPESGIRSR